MAPLKPRVTVVTAGHVSSCPRMLKAADALYVAGYRVRVVSARHTPWATAADEAVAATRRWAWTVVDYGRNSARSRQVATGVRFRAARAVARRIGADRIPDAVAIRACSRAHDELVRALVAEPADFLYGGTTGALAATAEAAATLGVGYALDLEDFHSGELEESDGALANALAERVERPILAGAAFLTAGSPMIADAYAAKYGVRPRAIHNTFSMCFPDLGLDAEHGPLRLYWFSQTLGAGRGLEEVIEGAGRANVQAELHLRARPIPAYLACLRELQRARAPRLTIVHHDPAPPDEMVRLAQPYDLGLSCEQIDVVNKRLALGNKIFTYLAAGIPVALSATPAQAALASDLDGASVLYQPGDVDALAEGLRRFDGSVDIRRRARAAARAAAERRWHWEHPSDRGALLSEIKAAAGA